MSQADPHRPIVSTSALARHLGLSRWTISRVLNGHAEVKPETCERVRAAMEELGFVPSPLGRALRGGRTGVVGVCFQALGSPIVARKIATLQRVLREAGFRALCELTDGNPELEREVVRHFVAMKVDGLVLVGGLTEANADAILTLFRAHGTRVVLVDPLQRFPLPTVELDREEAMRIALRHVFELGHTRIGLLGVDETVRYGVGRWRGIRAFAAEQRIELEKHFVRIAEPAPAALDFTYGARLADRVLALSRPQRPSALVALNDQIAIGAMTRLQQAGIVVPQAVSILGFDNLDIAAHVNPLLTTVDQHVEHMMESAVELLSEQQGDVAGGEPEVRVIIPRLVPRASTGPAPHRAVNGEPAKV